MALLYCQIYIKEFAPEVLILYEVVHSIFTDKDYLLVLIVKLYIMKQNSSNI
nr:MAG TPA: hypothetical protein [Crassvirales sp.]